MTTFYRITRNIWFAVLSLCVLAPISASAQVTFRHPLDTQISEYNSTAFFDNDTGTGVRDYKCGTQSRDVHDGVDFKAPTGTDVSAGAFGYVYARENTCPNVGSLTSTCGNGYGNHYRIDHQGNNSDGSGLATIYAHLEDVSVTIPNGTAVSCGQKIGRSASSGKSSGPHMHFTVRTDGLTPSTKVDPFRGVSTSCNTSPGYWTSVNGDIPTTQCQSGPNAPSNVGVANVSLSSLRVTFTDNAANETGIHVERRIGTTGAWTALGSFGVLTPTQSWNWENTGLASNQMYCYRLRAANGQGTSAYSNVACGTTSSASTPLAPSNVSISNATINSLRVNFTDNATNEVNIFVDRRPAASATWTRVATWAALSGVQSWFWTNTGLPSITTYCYRVGASNSSGTVYSATACGQTL